MKPIHASRPNAAGVRKLYTRCSRKHVVGGKNTIGELARDWCPDGRGRMITGYFWLDLAGNFGKTFPRMKDAIADFERERKERRERNNKR